ncbi:MAG: hypothetical protein KKF16_08930 [Euryarchaeota archaeon]|nr:hypothetical protein [Euryarchaeota archaeon]MBU4608205.1 hypothetical protein [Euryarchaeota archaeon]MBV1729505.1 hypothetical protein [Methanobacterium sp.]MBV1754860.1 hypothetical protein [Methanobacterium sp.]
MDSNDGLAPEEFINLQNRCFRVLEEISNKQLDIQQQIKGSKNVKDWDVYLKRRSTELQALRDARATVDSILKHIDRIAGIEDKIQEIESLLKQLGADKLGD